MKELIIQEVFTYYSKLLETSNIDDAKLVISKLGFEIMSMFNKNLFGEIIEHVYTSDNSEIAVNKILLDIKKEWGKIDEGRIINNINNNT